MMLTAERHGAILRLLSQNGRVTVAEIAERFQISAATARRDAAILAGTGRAARSHGGLLPADFFREEPALRNGVVRDTSARARIARRAAELLPHVGNVFVDAGSTCLEVGRILMERPRLHIITNSIPLLARAAESRATLIGIGGTGSRGSDALTGALSQTWISHLCFDAAVIGASGIDQANGAYAREPGRAAVRQEVMRRSACNLLAAVAEIWNNTTGVHFAPWSSFNAFVTDLDVPREARVALAADKVKWCRV